MPICTTWTPSLTINRYNMAATAMADPLMLTVAKQVVEREVSSGSPLAGLVVFPVHLCNPPPPPP